MTEMLVYGAVHPSVVVRLYVQAMAVAEVDCCDRGEVAVRLEGQVSLEDRLLGSLVEVESNGDSSVLEPRLVDPRRGARTEDDGVAVFRRFSPELEGVGEEAAHESIVPSAGTESLRGMP